MSPAIATKPPRTLLEVFLNLPEGTPAQLIKNNIIMSPSPLFVHQQVLDKIYRQLGNFVETNSLGQTICAPLDVYFDQKNIFQPDILFISNKRSSIIKEKGLYGAPDLVIEILSPSTAHYDLDAKKDVYEQYGVKEYWIVDPATKSAEGYSFKNNTFEYLEKNQGVIHSRLLDTTFSRF